MIKISEIRIKAGMSRRHLAKAVGITHYTLKRYEEGTNISPPPLQEIYRIAAILKVLPEQLFSQEYWEKHYYIEGQLDEGV